MTYRLHHSTGNVWNVIGPLGLAVTKDLTELQARTVAAALNELPAERDFKLTVRAVRHLTAEITVVATDEEAARTKAQNRFDHDSHIPWSMSDPEDFEIEAVEVAQ